MNEEKVMRDQHIRFNKNSLEITGFNAITLTCKKTSIGR
jgi:hypothetical protein